MPIIPRLNKLKADSHGIGVNIAVNVNISSVCDCLVLVVLVAVGVGAKGAPIPMLGFVYQSTLHGVAMHLAQVLHVLALPFSCLPSRGLLSWSCADF